MGPPIFYMKNHSVMKKRSILCMLLIILLIQSAGASKSKSCRFENIRCRGSSLIIDLRVKDLISEKILNGLQRGMTVTVEYQIQLWRKRPGWIDKFISERLIRMKLTYDTWERKYVISKIENQERTVNEEMLHHACSYLKNIEVTSTDRLDPGKKYFLAARVILHPLSVENIEEVRRWLAGEVRELNPKSITSSESPGKKAGKWFLSILLNLTGFGDKIVSGKSPLFYYKNGRVIIKNEKVQ